jgi:hypothetical protein
LDGWFLTFTGLGAEQLRRVILSSDTDEPVLIWVKWHAQSHTEEEQQQWAEGIAAYRPDATGTQYRREKYPKLAAQVDIGSLSVLDMIDMDERRLPVLGARADS